VTRVAACKRRSRSAKCAVVTTEQRRVLDVACGPHKRAGVIGIDLFPLAGVDGG